MDILEKRFNTTGNCVPKKHYMVNIDDKLKAIENMVNMGDYFTINRPRQFGKTTTLDMLEKKLEKKFLTISISLEGIGDTVFKEEKSFSNIFLELMERSLEFQDEKEARRLKGLCDDITNLNDVSKVITKFIKESTREVILIIDEVDKSSNNQLFLSFLGTLRNKYLLRNKERDFTFLSVILAGVHDVKNLKIKLRDQDEKKLNSPWNIAVDFDVNMSFNEVEIGTMLEEYAIYNNLELDIEKLSDRIYFLTDGYPFLVSRVCKTIDEKIYPDSKSLWSVEDIDKAVKLIIGEVNTLFESIVKNLENNEELYHLVKRILINSEIIIFNALDPIINIGVIHGIFKEGVNGVAISNKVFEEVIYNYIISKSRTTQKDMSQYNFKDKFITDQGGLDIQKILCKFQQFMKEQYSQVDAAFIEREGRLLFLAFIKPIINGVGFDFKEVQISEEKRLDIVITYNSFKYIIELKIWRGEKYHKDGLKQLSDYLDIHSMNSGFLVIFNFNHNKEYKEENNLENNKEIFTVYV